MACRQAASFLREEAAGTYGKSFRYWAKGPQGNRMVFGVNVSGERLNAPPANLYVWIPTGGLAEVSGMTEESVRGAINQRHVGFPSAPLPSLEPIIAVVAIGIRRLCNVK